MASVYAAAGLLLFATSAVYNAGTWGTVVHRRLRRADHADIYLLIAGSYTPIAHFGLEGSGRTFILVAVWVGALVGVLIRLTWERAPRWLTTVLYLLLGWCVRPFIAELFAADVPAAVLTLVGGALYTAGAVVYAGRWPDPFPHWLGFHELFHLFTIAAWTCQYIAICRLAWTQGREAAR